MRTAEPNGEAYPQSSIVSNKWTDLESTEREIEIRVTSSIVPARTLVRTKSRQTLKRGREARF